MSNTVEFILKLKDMMSNGMQQAAATAQRAMNTAERATQRVIHATRVAGVSVATAARTSGLRATRSISTLERALRMVERRRDIAIDTREVGRANRIMDRLQRRIDRLRGGRSGGGGMLASLGGMRGLVAGIGLTAGLGSVVNMGMQAQQQKASFEVMAGQQAGGQLFGDLTKFAQDSIFGNEVYQNAQTMKAFGMETKKVMPTMKMLGDISMGNKEKLGSLTLAFSQIQATGRLMGQDLLQLVNAGFNPLQVIAQKTGIGMAALKKKMEGGAISAKAVALAFQSATGPGGQFFDMTNKIAQTDFGKLEALKGQISGLGMQIGGVLAPAVGNLISNYLVPLVDNLSLAADWFGKNIGWIGALATGIGSAVVAIKAWIVVQAIINTLMTLNPIGLIIVAIGALVAGIIYAWNHWDKFRNYILKAWQALKDFGSLIKDVVITHLKNLLDGVKGIGHAIYLLFTGHFKEAFEAGKEAVLDLTGVNTAKAAYEGAKNLGEKWSQGVAAGIASGKNVIDFSKHWVLSGTSIGNQIGDVINKQKAELTGSGWFDRLSKSAIATKARQAAEDKKNAQALKNELNGGGGKGSGKSLSSGVTSGGPKTITINVNKEMIGQLAINSYNVREGVGEMEGLIEEGLRRLLHSAAAS